MINLKKFYFRTDDVRNDYLVPAEHIAEFDEWLKLSRWGTEYEIHSRTEEFQNYVTYSLEKILLYIHPDDLK